MNDTEATPKRKKGQKKCAQCGGYYYGVSKYRACSDLCRQRIKAKAKKKAQKKPRPKKCVICGNSYTRVSKYKTCSDSCSMKTEAGKALFRGYRQESKTSTEEAILKEIEAIKREKVKYLTIKEEHRNTHLWEYWEPFKWQTRCRDTFSKNLITLAPAPNGIGKTTAVVMLLMSWLCGYEGWNPVSEDYPGAVKHGNKFYKPSSLGLPLPVKGRLTGNDWSHHLGQTVVRELKKWLPMDEFDTKNNTQGVTWFWEHKATGSTLELMTHDQKIDLYESWRGHFWTADEPPPKPIFDAMSGRGLADFGGKILIPATPLTQAWMLDELVLKGRSDVGVMKDLCCLDNELIYEHDSVVLSEMGLSGKTTRYWREHDEQKKTFFDLILYKDDRGVAAEKFLLENTPEDKHERLMDLRFLKKAKDTPLEDKPSRFFGLFKKLVGLVIKNYDKDKHVLESFEIPSDWPVTVMIDLHLHKPHAISFFACDKHNRHYNIDEYWINCGPDEIADIIIKKKRIKCWNIENVYIDPLSKGDDKFMKNRADVEDSFSIIENLLLEADIELHVASKDKESGFRNIKAWLEGPNKLPILFFLDNLQSFGSSIHNGVLYEIQRLCFDDNGKIEKVDDDFMENLYRYTLTGTEYTENLVYASAGSHGGKNGWMGS